MTNSREQDASKKGCFSAILHRFLCSGGLPTHPSSDNEESPPSPIRNNTTPAGVVARLMGLDSFPNSPKLTLMQKSRSLGSLDHFLPNFHLTKQPPQLHHPRITTSLSFREVPTTFLHDLAKPDIGLTPIQETKPTNLKERVRVDTNINKNNNNNNNKKRQSVKLVKNGEEELVSSVPLKIRRKRGVNAANMKLDEHNKSRSKTYNHPLPKMGKHATKEKKNTSMLKRRECEYSEDYCIQVLKEVCRLTIVEIEGAAWVDTKLVDAYNIQQVSYEIGQQILQLLLYEMVDDLCCSL